MVELVTVVVQELHENLTQVMLRIHGATLDLRHLVQKMNDHADDRESADATVDGLVEATHAKKLLDNSHQLRHDGILLLPIQEGMNGSHAVRLLERDVNLEASPTVAEFE